MCEKRIGLAGMGRLLSLEKAFAGEKIRHESYKRSCWKCCNSGKTCFDARAARRNALSVYRVVNEPNRVNWHEKAHNWTPAA